MKKYYYTTKDNDKIRYIHEFKETDKANCSMCRGMEHFINIIYPHEKHEIPIRILNLCKANLKRHQATGKHWQSVNESWQ